jgi:hypothetical protein
VRVSVCVCARARARVCVCVCVYVCYKLVGLGEGAANRLSSDDRIRYL